MNRTKFIEFMETQRQGNGQPYTEKTVNSYANSLYWNSLRYDSPHAQMWRLCRNKFKFYATCFGDMDLNTLRTILDFIESDAEAKSLDTGIGNCTLSNAMKILIRGLESQQ